jgi:dTDP-glucose 4,6-dehydratase
MLHPSPYAGPAPSFDNNGDQMSRTRILITGGAGFLGSHFVRYWLEGNRGDVLNFDLLTYAGSPARLSDVENDQRYRFVRGDVTDQKAIAALMADFAPELVAHFAAESHVTRSEQDPDRFWRTNVDGTRVMLEAASEHGTRRFVHISTDEVYGPILDGAFREENKKPGDQQATSPYAKSKAIADDVAREFGSEMEVVVVRPTNCFGPWQYPEKAFARWIARALTDQPILVWGDGLYVRQWLYAEELAEAIGRVLEAEMPEPAYNVGPRHEPEITNVALARWLLEHLGLSEERLVFTDYDRPDHDRRYAVDPSRIESLGWKQGDTWDQFAQTMDWYRSNPEWWKPLMAEAESIYADGSKT